MRFAVVMLACVGLLLAAPLSGHGQQKGAVVQEIVHRTVGEGAEIIEVTLNGRHIPDIFMLDGEKPRLVLDFPETDYAGTSRVAVEGATLVQGIRVGITNTPLRKTRIVVDLAADRKISWSQDFTAGKNLLLVSITASEITATPVPFSPVVLSPVRGKVKVQPVPVTAVAKERDSQTAAPLETVTAAENIPDNKTEASGFVSPEQHKAGPVLLNVSFDNVYTKSGEMVLLKLNDFHPPDVSAVAKGTPRILCDFPEARIAGGVQSDIAAGGKYIETIQVSRHEDPAMVRVSLDLVAGNNYDLQQVFFKEDNLFVLIVNIQEPEE